ncbi:type IX secretion system membrane protein PorP/SprF [Fluviicola sp.]|uniref:PorP/SprF family type IX secretion system membrane protein n=1 Tax=Fluviicola sp. TaxID=1917219 RepID=UPI002635D06F|nr:type IX secretion system membrane protein PorP/SprF [Fluviicola sp.]
MKSRIILSAFIVLGLNQLHAQQEAAYTHYMYNTLVINPAYAGSRDALTFTALGRFQWVGFKGAPTTQTFTAHTPIAKKNIGLGLSVMNDKIGPTNNTSLNVDFAYRLKLSTKARLCFGVNGGFNSFSANVNTLTLADPNDVSFMSNMRGKMLPSLGAGIYFQMPNFYVGASVPSILENNLFATGSNSSVDLSKERRHYYFIAGAVFTLSPSVKFKPTALAKIVQNAPFQLDFTGTFMLRDLIDLGVMYRTGDGVGALLGVHISSQLLFGYSFDWSTGVRTGKYNGGSHELMLRYDLLFNNDGKIKSPRYF